MPSSPVLLLHICAGSFGLLSGAAAMSFRKGSRRHRLAGNVFVASMLILSASGAYLGFAKHEALNGLMGILTFYLVATAWWTARRIDGEVGIFDWGALLLVLAVGTGLMGNGLEAANSTGSKDGYPAAAYLIFGSAALLFAAGDVRMLVRGGVSGRQRIVRHLSRMCVALFIAAGSLFLGQPQLFPPAVHEAKVLFIPSLLPLVLLMFWLFRVRFANAYKGMTIERRGDVDSLRT